MTQPAFAVGAIEQARHALGIDAWSCRRNIVPARRRPAVHRPIPTTSRSPDTPRPLHRLMRVDRALREHHSTSAATSQADWLIGAASSIHETAPPASTSPRRGPPLCDDGMCEIAVGGRDSQGTSTAHVQIAASVLFTPRRSASSNPTPMNGFHTTPSPAASCSSPATRCCGQPPRRDRMLLLAADHTGVDRASCFLADDTVICGGKRIQSAS